MDKQKDNYRYPRGILVIVSVLYLCLSSINFAEAESITVYVKDQTGDNVHDHPNLLGKLRVDLSYEGKIIKTMNFTNQDHIIFSELNHTGLYTVRAVAVVGFNESNICYLTFKDIAGLDKCQDECLNTDFIYDEAGYMVGYNNINDRFDDHGPYRCRSFSCEYVDLGGDDSFYECTYNQFYKYTQMNEVLTHVDKGESDVAEVVLLTDFNKLGRYGKRYSHNILNLSNIRGGLNPDPIYTLNDATDSAVQEGLEAALDEAIDKAKPKDKKILNYIFDGSLKQGFITEAGSTLVILGVEGITDPDSLKVNSKNWGYIVADVGISAAAEYAIGSYVLGGVLAEGGLVASVGGPIAIGVVVAIPVGMGLDFVHGEEHEWHMCEHALEDVKDDIYLYIYEPNSGCTPTYYSDSAHGECQYVDECSRYPIIIINKGEPVSNLSIGVDSDPVGCGCVTANSSKEDILSTNMIYSDNALYSYQSLSEDCHYSSKFNEYARLWMNLEVLPGVFTDFDTLGFSDAPMLNELNVENRPYKNRPYIENPSFPEVVYVGDSPNISVVMVDSKEIISPLIKWMYGDPHLLILWIGFQVQIDTEIGAKQLAQYKITA